MLCVRGNWKETYFKIVYPQSYKIRTLLVPLLPLLFLMLTNPEFFESKKKKEVTNSPSKKFIVTFKFPFY